MNEEYGKWISVEDRLPKQVFKGARLSKKVLVALPDGRVEADYCNYAPQHPEWELKYHGKNYLKILGYPKFDGCSYGATHWMPFPTKP